MRRIMTCVLAAVCGAGTLAGCGSASSPAARGDCPAAPVRIVASVSSWGSVAHALAGDCGTVTSLLSGASVDPHEYEPVPSDLGAIGRADIVVVNGLGYDAWAARAVDTAGRGVRTVDAAALIDAPESSNPHLWFDLDAVAAVARSVEARLVAARPAARSFLAARFADWTRRLTAARRSLDGAQAALRGTSFVATEPVAGRITAALGLADRTPETFRAGGEDAEPSPTAVADLLARVEHREVELVIVNPATSGSLPDRVRAAAKTSGVPVVEVGETLPAGVPDVLVWLDRIVHEMEAARR